MPLDSLKAPVRVMLDNRPVSVDAGSRSVTVDVERYRLGRPHSTIQAHPGDQAGPRILPAFYSDNYISLLPGEQRKVEISYPASAAKGSAHVALRGWNTVEAQAEAR